MKNLEGPFDPESFSWRARMAEDMKYEWRWYHDDSIYTFSCGYRSLVLERRVRTNRTGYRAPISFVNEYASEIEAQLAWVNAWRPDPEQCFANLGHAHKTENPRKRAENPFYSPSSESNWFTVVSPLGPTRLDIWSLGTTPQHRVSLMSTVPWADHRQFVAEHSNMNMPRNSRLSSDTAKEVYTLQTHNLWDEAKMVGML